MPTLIVYDDDVINAVQPEVAATPVGTVHSTAVDANLSQYTTDSSVAYSCSDVNELTLWTLSQADIAALFVSAGAIGLLEPDNWSTSAIWLNEAGDKLIITSIGTFSSTRYLYLGVSDISGVGVVAEPTLTGYLRMRLPGVNLYTPVGVWERHRESGLGSLVIMTRDFTTTKVQWHICPTVEQVETGEFKGAHAGCTGTLAVDQGPGLMVGWTSSTAIHAGYVNFQEGNVADNPIGFLAHNMFYFVVPRAWMESTDNGFGDNWADDRPNGGVFTVDMDQGEYATHSWDPGDVRETITIADDAEDVTDTAFTPALPWAEEYTRILDEGANGGWLASYCGRPALTYVDGSAVLLFGVIDGNTTYETGIGTGERVFYAKVRGYKWTGAAFSQFDTEGGIVLRDGDLAFTGYEFDEPESQNIFLVGNDIYFQIGQYAGMGGDAGSRSILTRFGSLVESETRQTEGVGIGRSRYVPRG